MGNFSRKYIEDRSVLDQDSGCWLWTKSVGSHGYGNACANNEITTAHRASYRSFVGAIPKGALVQHSCDNRRCVNPGHLSIGTDATNAEDKKKKGRAVKKLSLADRASIRSLYADGEWTQRALAKRFLVTQRAVWDVLHDNSAL